MKVLEVVDVHTSVVANKKISVLRYVDVVTFIQSYDDIRSKNIYLIFMFQLLF